MESGCDGSSLCSTVRLLENTSAIVSLFNDRLSINSTRDERLHKLQKFYTLMVDWSKEVGCAHNLFISQKLWFDIQSMCLGFKALVSFKLHRFPNSVVKPAITNQDCVENHFCQVRSCNGQNNNPTYLQQQSTQNSIRIGQTLISRKSNARLQNKNK